MFRQGIKLALLVAVLGAIALSPAVANAAEHDVWIENSIEWTPANMTADVGDEITWHLTPGVDGTYSSGHDVWLCTGIGGCSFGGEDPPPANYVAHAPTCVNYDGIPDGECEGGTPPSLTHTFNTPGTYTYQCQIHSSSMTGTLTVNDTSTPPPPPPPARPNIKPNVNPKKKNLRQGKAQRFTVRVTNRGKGQARNVRVCAKGPNKKVKTPKCKKLNNINPGQTKRAKMRVKVKNGKKAKGNARVRFQIKVGNGANRNVPARIKIKPR